MRVRPRTGFGARFLNARAVDRGAPRDAGHSDARAGGEVERCVVRVERHDVEERERAGGG